MRKRQLAILGLGRLGQACANAIVESEDLAIAGLVRRPETLRGARPDILAEVPVVDHPSALPRIDAALICLPADRVAEAARDLLRHHTPIIEAAIFEGDALAAHWQALDRMAQRRGVPAVVGAGWDPGMRALFDRLLAALCPRGGVTTHDRPGVSLHHTLAVRALPGVRDALCAELKGADGRVQRYVYLALKPDADFTAAATAIQADPLFLGEDTIVLPVASLADLEAEGHGFVLERWGRAGGKDHQRFLVEGRFDRVSVAGQVMVAAARALPLLPPGAHPLSEVPLSAW